MNRRILLPLLAPGLAVAALVTGPAPAAQAVGSCAGLPATIEQTTPGGTLTGTDGPDVILATSAATINALGGDDVICSAGGALDAGAGNDSVHVIAPTAPQTATLGPGANHYVSAGAMSIDTVFSGTPGEPNLDVVDLGASAGQVVATLPAGSHLQAKADSVAAQAVVQGLVGDTSTWDLALPGTLSRDGAQVASFTGFGSSYLDLAATASAKVRGTTGADTVGVSAGRVDADLGGGDDRFALGSSRLGDQVGINTYYSGAVPTKGRVDLGKGRSDRLFVAAPKTIRLDLAKGRLGKVKVAGIEISDLQAGRVSFVGSKRADIAVAWACRTTMRGGAGNDFLGPISGEEQTGIGCKPRYRLFGEGGNDELKGDRGGDLLIGGAGRDRANGHEGRDTCSAEREANCEVQPA